VKFLLTNDNVLYARAGVIGTDPGGGQTTFPFTARSNVANERVLNYQPEQ
jgi:hypothetical protein